MKSLEQSYYNEQKCSFHYPFDLTIPFIKQGYNSNQRVTMIPKKINGVEKPCRYDGERTDARIIPLLRKECPKYIDIGKIISNIDQPIIGTNIIMTFIKKEVVFDIDATDYDNVNKLGLLNAFNNSTDIKLTSLRICNCQGKKQVCGECWYLLSSASLIINYFVNKLLGNDVKLLWVYSGNRGLHCWLKNNQLDKFNSFQRESIIDDISLDTDFDMFKILCSGNTLYIDLLNNVLYPFFIKYIVGNNRLFNKLKTIILIFINVYYNSIHDKINVLWNDEKEEGNHWLIFEGISKLFTDWKFKSQKLPQPHLFIIMRLLYVVLDKGVTKSLEHLLKLPYSIHKTTNRLSFPVTQEQILNFPIDDKVFLDSITIGSHKECKNMECSIYKLMEDSKILLNEWLK